MHESAFRMPQRGLPGSTGQCIDGVLVCAAGSAKGQSSKLTSMTSVESNRASFMAAGFEPDWAIPEDDLSIFQEPDGSDCILGEGSFGECTASSFLGPAWGCTTLVQLLLVQSQIALNTPDLMACALESLYACGKFSEIGLYFCY